MATRTATLAQGLRRFVPEGRPLPDAEWQRRHVAILLVIGTHALIVAVFGVYQRYPPLQSLAEGGVVGALGLVAAWARPARAFREAVAALALVVSSSIIVQFSGGYIEAHFHFFVILAVIALYQSWTPFLLAILFVAIDHGVIGTLAPAWVYNHGDAFAHPWKWAVIHAVMVLSESVALTAAWKLAENARNRTDLVLENAGDAILGTSTEGEVIFANPAAARLAGTRVDDMLGHAIDEYLPDVKSKRHAEGQFRSLGAELVPVEFDRSPIVDNGVEVGTVVTVKDIRERKKAEAALTSAVSALSATLESTTDGILVIDRQGRIAHHNQRFVEIWRIPFDVLALGDDKLAIESVLSQLRHPQEFVDRVQHLYAAPQEESFDTLLFKDERVIERYSRPHRLPSGEIIGRVWSFRDVTQRKKAEEAALESRVARPLARMMMHTLFSERKRDVGALMRLGEDIARQVDAPDVREALLAYKGMGLGTLEADALNGARHTFVGRDLFERDESATATTCHIAVGFLCGTMTRLHGLPALGTEVACQSRGDVQCRFVISTRKPG